MTSSTTVPRKRSKLRLLAGITGVLVVAALVAGAGRLRDVFGPQPTLPELLKVGSAAPAFTATDIRGTSHSLAGYSGKWVVLEWFNHSCPYTKKHYAELNGVGNTQAMQKEYTKRGVVWLSVVSSAPGRQGFTSAEDAAEDARDKGAAPTAIIRDTAGVLGRLYGARTTPQYAIIGPDGVLRYAGAVDSRQSSSAKDIPEATNYVRAALDSGLAGRPIAMAQTQPYGCDVKY